MREYPIVIIPLSEGEGGGYLGRVPDLPGCLSDGASPEEALLNARQAIRDWIGENERLGRATPPPGSAMRRASLEKARLAEMLQDAAKSGAYTQELWESLIEEARKSAAGEEGWARYAGEPA
ncbi:type II toxin-antitoxin system HicB family antitoxin [Afifella sp. IM 167]|uniref:type II toxin-antitoxin system HicB family antitoxin n=1 Tax=Afifella sp. IM 167 TaxID=2033586 RepID=UPI001CCFFCE2|nr:type II toxin-antitoxin system HicB family antitoxin [Afifella sp. IM 167]MBZ8133808.1 HicB family protein [Afifella sp. IM 167]